MARLGRPPASDLGGCAAGHPLDGPDADVYVSPAGVRQCRVCRRRRDHERARNYDGVVSLHRQRYNSFFTEEARFWSQTKATDYLPAEWIPSEQSADRLPTPCVLWTGTTREAVEGWGYGVFRTAKGAQVGAHVWAWAAAVGRDPGVEVSGRRLHINHICRVLLCVNSEHLEEVTGAVNSHLGERPRALHCKNKHPFSLENTYIWTDKRGRVHRLCRTCRAAALQRSRTK